MLNYKLGWVPDKYDPRDLKFTRETLLPIKTVYLSTKYKLPPVYDQGQLGSCTANALAGLVHYDLLNHNDQNKQSIFRPSRLFIYYFERALEGTISTDSGAEIRDGIKVLSSKGAPSEDLWPYDIDLFAVEPPTQSITQALKYEAITYENIDNTNKQLLVNALLEGFPIAFGIVVYNSFISEQVAGNGIVPMPAPGEPIAGGHAMIIVGYSTEYDSFIVRNSWGTDWGQNGYCRIPADYICSSRYSSDFWVVNLIK